MKPKKLTTDAVLIGSWDELPKGTPLSSITKNADDVEQLEGLIIRGYETKFADGTNANGERYTKEAIDKFIKSYFIERGLNMPVDIEHDPRPEWLAGRVVYIETNSTGFYYVAYIPKTFLYYNEVKNLLKNGILQGFSKSGWATKYHPVTDSEGHFLYELIEEIEIVRMSIVSTPANGVSFEKVEAVENAIRYENKLESIEQPKEKKAAAFADLFNNKK